MPFLRILAHLQVLTALVAGFLAGPAIFADGPSWPQFHGPNRDNVSTETGLLERWPEEGPKLLWTASGLGHGYASVAIADRVLYTAGNVGDDTVITAMDLGGKTLWQVTNGRAWHNPKPGARGTPTLEGGRLYHESPHGDVVCLDAKTGKRIWGLNVLEEFNSRNIEWGLAESLLVDGDRVICRPGGPEVSFAALDKHTGRVAWRAPSSGDLAGYSSTALGQCGGLRILFALGSKALVGANADTGELLFRFEHESPFDENITMPVYHDGHVLISTRTTGTVMLEVVVDGERASVTPVWRCQDLDNQHGGVVLVDGYLYGASHVRAGGRWICLDWKTGRKRYVEPGLGKGSLTYADGMLYTLSERGTVGLVRATPAGHEVISRFEIPRGGEGFTWAHPVVCGGRLYVRHSDFLYVYDVRARP
ncbi:MAG: PQQ-binding-like beta-propeller repeat protein [Planctomycetota bacterium]|jgi:outer membrane protein assembly factor BamB